MPLRTRADGRRKAPSRAPRCGIADAIARIAFVASQARRNAAGETREATRRA